MRKLYSLIAALCVSLCVSAQADYNTTVTFPANFQIGDYNEFVLVAPINVGSSGYYEISLSYTRGNIAAAATHLASISHANPSLWREVGRINNNPYTNAASYNFTIDCNTQSSYPRFRVRAVNTLGVTTDPIAVSIKVRSINQNSSWTALNSSGNDITVTKFLPMTSDWNLYVGNSFTTNGASLAIKAIENGNVGIGTSSPDSKLTVNGTVHSKSVVVDMNVFADYVFHPKYVLPSLSSVDTYIKKYRHLPEIPSEKEVIEKGLDIGEMNKLLTKKVEELTLYLIEKDNQIIRQQKTNGLQKNINRQMAKRLEMLEKKFSH